MKISVCYYVATTIDGLISDARGDVGWLDAFSGVDYGFQGFFNSIDTVVMGRRTYDRLLARTRVNPYKGKRLIVLSRFRSSGLFADLFWPGPMFELMPRLELMGTKSVWIVGGGAVAGSFLEAGLISEVQQFVMPLALGCGTPLFGPMRDPVALQITGTQSFANGVLQLRYVPTEGRPGVQQDNAALTQAHLASSTIPLAAVDAGVAATASSHTVRSR